MSNYGHTLFFLGESMEKIVEICCGSYEDALAAYGGGAQRIELNSALYLGGLTPSLGSLILTKKYTNLKVIAMVRPRGAGFCYTESEFEMMKMDAELLMKNGADGIAFGCLDENSNIDMDKTTEMIRIINKYQGEVVFHRAFDCIRDPHKAIKVLIELGVDRILTSGLQEKAMDGINLIAELQENYGKEIEILAGSGINISNVKEIMSKTGITQVHSSCKDWKEDVTTSGEYVSFSYGVGSKKELYDVVSRELVKQMVDVLSIA